MADGTKIEWTDATWNPITGCSVVSPGCTNCYAMKLAGTRLKNHPSRMGLTKDTKAGPVWTGEVRFNAEWLDQPLRWTKPRMIFVCAHGDLFAEGVPDEWIDQVFAVMALCPEHTFQVLTKRPERMREYLAEWRQFRVAETALQVGRNLPDSYPGWSLDQWKPSVIGGCSQPAIWPLPNVWLGVSVEDQRRAEERIPILLDTPAAIRWISAEPLLGPVDISRWTGTANVTCKACRKPFWLHEADPCKHKEEGAGWTLACPHCGKCRCKPVWTEADARCGVPMGPPADWIDRKIGRFDTVHPTIEVKSLLDWVVVGGESGPGARPMHPDWARSLRDQCAIAGVPFLFKQWGEWAPRRAAEHADLVDARKSIIVRPDGGVTSGLLAYGTNAWLMDKAGKRRGGRLLDGVEHNGYPQPVRTAPIQADRPSRDVPRPVRSEAGAA
ncbi:MAG: phage Gp37/Gp68 family protein, partial [Rhizobiaceae bacterium]|nr:phage Gp37/Gp68 family protein [Rhizobiaceae bacterium]